MESYCHPSHRYIIHVQIHTQTCSQNKHVPVYTCSCNTYVVCMHICILTCIYMHYLLQIHQWQFSPRGAAPLAVKAVLHTSVEGEGQGIRGSSSHKRRHKAVLDLFGQGLHGEVQVYTSMYIHVCAMNC